MLMHESLASRIKWRIAKLFLLNTNDAANHFGWAAINNFVASLLRTTMGLFQRQKPVETPDPLEMVDSLGGDLSDNEEFRLQVMGIVTFLVVILSLRLMNQSRLKALTGEHVLDLSALNDTVMYKEVFLAYLNAALLEPVLAIGGMEEVKGQELVINVLTLGSICWWIWMVTDAFE